MRCCDAQDSPEADNLDAATGVRTMRAVACRVRVRDRCWLVG